MEETKRCPYCGEEILAVAKKCKHCGEWLEEKSPQMSTTTQETELKEKHTNENIDSSEDEKQFSKNIPLSNIAIQCLFWVAIIGLAISTAHALISDGEMINTSIGAARTRVFAATINFLSTIPEWMGDVLWTFGEIALLLTIGQAMSKMRQSFDNLFAWLVYAVGASSALSILVDFIEADDEWAFSFAAFLFFLIQIILQIILGIKISMVYTGRLNYLGKVMYICGGGTIVLCILAVIILFVLGITAVVKDVLAGVDGNMEFPNWITITLICAFAILNLYYYSTLKAILIREEED